MSAKSWLIASFAAATLTGAAVALAGAPVGATYIEGQVHYVSPDKAFGAEDDAGAHYSLGRVLNDRWDLQLGYAGTSHKLDGANATLDFHGLDLHAHRVFDREARLNPFLSIGVNGYNSTYTGGHEQQSLGLDVGGGLMYALGPVDRAGAQIVADVGLRTDSADRGNGSVNGKLDPYAGLGLRLNFGGRRAAEPVKAVAPPPPPPAPVDSDGDGVPDSADKCPNTPAGAKVDSDGCELDSDRDGVVDRLDKCPNTPPGEKVDANGCELDDDHDGVVNRIDKCPNTPAGDKVDAVGCGMTIALQVNFDTDSATIKPESYAELDRFVEFMKAVPSAKGDLEGHTDSRGADAYNKKLSQKRADAVKAYAVDKGVDASRIHAVGYGESRPVADNKTEEGRAQNRRVQFVRASLQP